MGIDDVVAVILEWGRTGGDADVNEDRIVNVDDLVDVVLDWGPCPGV